MCLPLLLNPGQTTFDDFNFPTSPETFLSSYLPIWNDYGSQSNLENIYRIPSRLPFIILAFFSTPMEIITKLMILSTFLIGTISMLYFLNTFVITNKKELFPLKIVISLIYMFNPFAIERIPTLSILFGYATYPLILLFFIKALKKNSTKHLLIDSLLITIAVSHPFNVFVITISLTIIGFYFLIIEKTNIKQLIKQAFILTLSFLLLSSFYLLPLIPEQTSKNSTEISHDHYFISRSVVDQLSSTNFINLTILSREVITRIPPINSIIPNTLWISCGIIFVILASIGFIISKNKQYLPILTIGGIGLLLSMGTNSLLGDLYFWATKEIPLGWLLRSSTKWQFLLPLVYCTGVGLLFVNITNKERLKKLFFPLFILLIIVATIWIYPYYSWYFNNNLSPVVYPEEFKQINSYIEKYSGSKSLWIPGYESATTDWEPNKIIAPFDYKSSSIESLGNSASSPKEFSLYQSYLFNSILDKDFNFNNYLLPLNVKVIIFRTDYLSQILPFISPTGNINSSKKIKSNLNSIYSSLLNQSELKFVADYNFIKVFENQTGNKIYSVNKIIVSTGGLSSISKINNLINPKNSIILFTGQNNSSIDTNFDYLFLENSLNDLIPTFLDKKTILNLNEVIQDRQSNKWSVASPYNLLHAEWNSIKEINLIKNYDFDYGQNFFYCSYPETNFEKDFKILNKEKHFLIIRYLKNTYGGEIKIQTNTNIFNLSTASSENQFVTEVLELNNLNEGINKINVVSKMGFNAINILAILKESELIEIQNKIEKIKNEKLIINNFKSPKNEVLIENEKIIITFNIPIEKEADYEIIFNNNNQELLNKYTLLLNQNEIKLNNKSTTNLIKLNKGINKLIIIIDDVKLTDTEKNLVDFNKLVTIGESEVLFSKKIITTINDSNKNNWAGFTTDFIQILPSFTYTLESSLTSIDTNKLHFKVNSYDEKKILVSSQIIEKGIDGSKTIDFNKIINFDSNIKYIRLVFLTYPYENKKSYFEINKLIIKSSTPYPKNIESLGNNLIILEKNNQIKSNLLDDNLTYNKISPAEYTVESNQFVKGIVLTEVYDPNWEFNNIEDNLIIKSLPANGVSNFFEINSNIKNSKLTFIPQKNFEFGAIISILTLIIISVYLIKVEKNEKQKK